MALESKNPLLQTFYPRCNPPLNRIVGSAGFLCAHRSASLLSYGRFQCRPFFPGRAPHIIGCTIERGIFKQERMRSTNKAHPFYRTLPQSPWCYRTSLPNNTDPVNTASFSRFQCLFPENASEHATLYKKYCNFFRFFRSLGAYFC